MDMHLRIKERLRPDRFQAEAKHYSECAEFSEYIFHANGMAVKFPSRRQKDQIPEKELENYLKENLERLEPGLKLSLKKAIGKWEADIFAVDASGADVLIELKSSVLNRDKIDKLCGQVSRYYHHQKPSTNNLRLFIVIPADNKSIDYLRHGFKPLIEEGKMSIFHFDYYIYRKMFTFEKIDSHGHARGTYGYRLRLTGSLAGTPPLALRVAFTHGQARGTLRLIRFEMASPPSS